MSKQHFAATVADDMEFAGLPGFDPATIITFIPVIVNIISTLTALCKKPIPPNPTPNPSPASDHAWNARNLAIQGYRSKRERYRPALVRRYSEEFERQRGLDPEAATQLAISTLDYARLNSQEDVTKVFEEAA